METKRYTLRLTYAEAVALRDRLVPIAPMEYSLQTYSILRDLYGRLDHWILKLDTHVQPAPKGDYIV